MQTSLLGLKWPIRMATTDDRQGKQADFNQKGKINRYEVHVKDEVRPPRRSRGVRAYRRNGVRHFGR